MFAAHPEGEVGLFTACWHLCTVSALLEGIGLPHVHPC